MNRLGRFMLSGILMAAATLIMRFVSVAFNVYISNRAGAVAMGLFTLISTVYGFAITLGTSGINLATTRLVAEAIGDTSKLAVTEISEEKRSVARCILRKCIIYAVIFGGISGIALFLLADKIGAEILRDPRTVRSLRLLSVTLVPIAVSSVLCGYFSAVRQVYKNAVMQLFGQGVKIFSCIAFLSAISAKDTESACIAIAAGGAVSELLSFAAGLLLYLADRKKLKSKLPIKEKKKLTKNLLSNALPLAFSTYMRSALVTIEHILIPYGLERSGSSRDASLAAYGTVGSMVFPLILFPSAISASFAGLLIPEVAESSATGDTRRIKGIVCTVMETVLIFAIGCAGIMMSFSQELGQAIYPNSDTAGKYVLILAPLIPVMYLDTAVDAMLKGLGEQVYSMWVNIIDAAASVILVATLLPIMGIKGYIITVYFTEILNAALSITRLLIKSKAATHAFAWVLRPLICVICSTRLTHFFTVSKYPYSVWLHVTVAITLYVLFMILLGGIKPKHITNRIAYIMGKTSKMPH